MIAEITLQICALALAIRIRFRPRSCGAAHVLLTVVLLPVKREFAVSAKALWLIGGQLLVGYRVCLLCVRHCETVMRLLFHQSIRFQISRVVIW